MTEFSKLSHGPGHPTAPVTVNPDAPLCLSCGFHHTGAITGSDQDDSVAKHSVPAMEQIQRIAKGLVDNDSTLTRAASISKAAQLNYDLVVQDRIDRGFGH